MEVGFDMGAVRLGMVEIISKKKHGEALTREEIRFSWKDTPLAASPITKQRRC